MSTAALKRRALLPERLADRLEGQYPDQFRHLDDMVQTVSHTASEKGVHQSAILDFSATLSESALRATRLTHSLVDHFRFEKGKKDYDPSKSALESIVCCRFADDDRMSWPVGRQAYGSLLSDMVRLLTAGSVLHPRNHEVFLCREGRTGAIVLPDAEAAARAICLLDSDCGLRSESRSACSKAVALFSVVLNAHPFPDGNGRLARVMFNIALRRHCTRWPYLPLYDLMHRSGGAFELCFREAELFGEWEPLLNYFEVCLCIQRDALAGMSEPGTKGLAAPPEVRTTEDPLRT